MKNLILIMVTVLFVAAFSLSACGGDAAQPTPPPPKPTPAPKGSAKAGAVLFATTCVACHGADAKGLPGLGKDMTTSQFIAGKTDDQLLAFIKVGRPITDTLNTTGVAMPAKGANPNLTDDDLYDIIAYIRSLHKK